MVEDRTSLARRACIGTTVDLLLMAQLTSILPRLSLVLSLVYCSGCWSDSTSAPRFQVASSSMAPALLGPTLGATCPNCQYGFVVAAETYRPTLPTRCPNCGGLCDVDPTIHPGQTVRMEPLAAPADVRRWDLIAFEDIASGTLQVKRVWGLPGESIELRQGEAWIDGVMLRKSLPELRRVAVPVYDLSRGAGGRWWSYEGEPSHSVAHTVETPLHGRADQWYQLQHVRPAPVHTGDVAADQWLQPSPVIDVYSINQGLSTADHLVADGLISLRMQQPLDSPLCIGLRVGDQSLYVWVQPAELMQPSEAGALSAAVAAFPAGMAPSDVDFRIVARQRIELGWCDGRLLLETDLQTRVIEAEELEALAAAAHVSQPDQPAWVPQEICRLASAQPVDISYFRFARDLYLTSPSSTATDHRGEAAEQLASFYVLGDNLAASRDSRQELGRVPAGKVLGRIVASPRP